MDNSNVVGIRALDNAEAVQLATTADGSAFSLNTMTNELVAANLPTAGEDGIIKDFAVLENLKQKYGYYVGNLVGVYEAVGFDFIMLRSNDTEGANKFVPASLAYNPPVVDVGRKSTQTGDEYLDYFHVIYGATVADAKVSTSDKTTAELQAMKTNSNLADMANAVNATESGYIAGSSDDSLDKLLAEYRLSESEVDLFKAMYNADGYAASGSDSLKIDFPILVYKTEHGPLQNVMETIVNVMTNVAGNSATDMRTGWLTVSAAAMKYDGTRVINDGTSCIAAENNDGETIYYTNDGVSYDGLVTVNGNDYLTFTELTFTYSWGGGHQKTFRLPIFVEEPILYNVHMNIKEGRVTNVSDLRDNGTSDITNSNKIVIANDSDYSVLMEYTYSKARLSMPDATTVNKYFAFEWSTGNKIPAGTKLMLIDVSGGNKAYYYEVSADEADNIIEFTDFKDSKGVAYVNKSINSVENLAAGGTCSDMAGDYDFEADYGTEQYILTVFAADDNDSAAYTISTGLLIDEDLKSRFYLVDKEHEEIADLYLVAVPKVNIQLSNESITGKISHENGQIVVSTDVTLTADGLYWKETETTGNPATDPIVINSANNGMYLELGFYLKNEDNSSRVKLPAGTNISYYWYDEETGNSTEAKVIPNDSVFYFYKDIGEMYGIDDLKCSLDKLLKTDNPTLTLKFTLDFSGADLTNITEDNYNAWIELLRTSNPEYPTGSGNKLDSFSANIMADAVQPLGFAIHALDLSELAINTYPLADDSNTINYEVMFDFSALLGQTSGIGLETLSDKWRGYDYQVTYQLYKKTENTGATVTYEEYTGNLISIQSTGDVAGSTNIGQGGTLTVTYRFENAEDLTNGILNDLITRSGKLIIDTDALTASDIKTLTNYKLKATLVIMERPDAEGGEDVDINAQSGQEIEVKDEETSDFFIYTLTRLKTDL